ncbi:hypothetical protein CMN23_02355 [Candidatus Saccharibacteria bacterium]|nr:hypothetical protein [Candidatus Saccharibacteria bacterium]|tara:strand:- start:346 stop:1044 length:699 start_codon:yes stop_codon:yes gene_type:complete
MDANWWFRKIVLGIPLRLFFPVRVTGRKNLPRSGSYVIVAGSHTTEVESALIAAHLHQLKIRFFAKAEYWHHRLGAWFFNATGQRPVDRSARDIQREVVGVGVELLRTESRTVLLLYPESTRSYDGKVHAGGLSPARIAIQADVPLVPIGLVGMEKIQPPGKKLWQLRPFRRAGIHIGAPIYPWAAGSRPEGVIKGAIETIEAKVLTERAMRAIADLCGKDYSPDRLKIPGR